MQSIRKYGTVIFLLLLIIHCWFIYLNMNDLRVLTKLLLLPFLILYLFALSEKRVRLLFVAALSFSFIGDLLLAFPGELYFMLGMLAFILTHICNSISFFHLQKTGGSKAGITAIAITILAVLVFMVFIHIYPALGSLLVPIIVYMIVIGVMAVLASRTISVPALKKTAVNCFIPGAFLFALSDGILAINKFFLHKPNADIAVMATYGFAQYLLVRGFYRIPGEGRAAR